MKIVNLLNNLSQTGKALDDQDRIKLHNFILETPKKEAELLYTDLCYMYICICSGKEIQKTKLQILTIIFSEKFIRGLVDIGIFMQNLEDFLYLTETERIQKWKNNLEHINALKLSHKQNSEVNAAWSKFLFESRLRNKEAYDIVKFGIKNKDLNWKILIVDTFEELLHQPPLFFNNLQFNDRSILEKRAIVYKFLQIYNMLPNATKTRINDLLTDIYIHERNEENNINYKNRSKQKIKIVKKSCFIL